MEPSTDGDGPAPRTTDAETVASLLEKLENLYWESTTREVCNMVLFYKAVWDYKAPEDTGFYWGSHPGLAGENFGKLFEAWTGGQEAFCGRDFDTTELAAEAKRRATAHDTVESPEYRCARYLLQSSGLLDIDVLFEPSSASSTWSAKTVSNITKLQSNLRDMGLSLGLDLDGEQIVERVIIGAQENSGSNSVRVEEGEAERDKVGKIEDDHVSEQPTAWLPFYCAQCHKGITTMIYFECTKGCTADPVFPLRVHLGGKTKRLKKIEQYKKLGLRGRPRRLCYRCGQSSTQVGECTEDHMTPQEQDNRPITEKEPLAGNRSLRDKLFHPSRRDVRLTSLKREYRSAGRRLRPLDPVGVWDIPAVAENQLQQLIPIGFFHLAFMFGPLIIESGTAKSWGGCLVSPRPLPSLNWDQEAAWAVIDGKIPGESQIKHGCFVFYQDRNTGERLTRYGAQDTESIPILGSVKHVYGGAFSGYLENKDQERDLITIFIQEAKNCKLLGKNSERRQRMLKKAAKVITGAIKRLLASRVRGHLWRVARTLMETTLEFHAVVENCQDFLDRLLRGQSLETLFPRTACEPVPTHDTTLQETDVRAGMPLRHLISFGDRLMSRQHEAQQLNSVVTAFFLDRSDQSHLIDFIQSLLCKYGEDQELEKWDELLLQRQPTNDLTDGTSRLDARFLDMLWLLPRDTLSILQSHFLRPRDAYPGKPLEEKEWLVSRLRGMRQLDLFASVAGGLGAAVVDVFGRQEPLLNQVVMPHSMVYGLLRAGERVLTSEISDWVCYIVLGRETPKWFERVYYENNGFAPRFMGRISPPSIRRILSLSRDNNLPGVEEFLRNYDGSYPMFYTMFLAMDRPKQLKRSSYLTHRARMTKVAATPYRVGGTGADHLAFRWDKGLTVLLPKLAKAKAARKKKPWRKFRKLKGCIA